MNDTFFLMKIGWEILNFPYILWVQVLTNKYGPRLKLQDDITWHIGDSQLWKEFATSCLSLLDSIGRQVSNGGEIWFWSENWLGIGNELRCNAIAPRPSIEDLKTISDCVATNGHWNWEALG